MIFVDSNPFIYAFYKPRYGALDEKKKDLKNKSKEIVKKINEGEKVLTTTVHISEVYNLLKRNYNQEMLNRLVHSLILKENIQIASIDESTLLSGQEIAIDNKIDLNDGIAVAVMQQMNVHEIYSFDAHFDSFKWIKRLTK